MSNTKYLYKQLVMGTGMGILSGVILWLAALFAAASSVRSARGSIIQPLQLGPLELGAMTKTVTNSATTVVVSTSATLLWLLFGCILLGIGIRLLLGSRHSAGAK